MVCSAKNQASQSHGAPETTFASNGRVRKVASTIPDSLPNERNLGAIWGALVQSPVKAARAIRY